MANENVVVPTPQAVAANNAKVAQALVQQGADKLPNDLDTRVVEDALDKLAAQFPEPPKPDAPPPVVEPKPDDAKAEEAKAAEAAAAKAAEDAKAAEAKAAEAKRAEELFKDAPQLPPNSTPKAAEAFSAIKIKAAQDISARDAEIEKLKKDLAELTKKAATPSTEQLEKEKELEDLRQWRAKMDVEFDPKFKTFDKDIAGLRDFVYAQLKTSPVITDAVIEEIKKHGGPDMVNLSKIFEAIKDPTMQRVVESKVADIFMAKYAKEQAVKAAKDNVQGYLKEREGQVLQAATAHTQATQQKLQELLDKLDWIKERQPAANADEAAKKSVEEHNKFVSDVKAQVAEAVRDDSPKMRAILITATAQLFNLQRIHAAVKGAYEALTKEHAALAAKWDKVKSSSRALADSGGAPPGGVMPKKEQAVNTDTSSALDALAKEISEKRQAAGR